jgi:hypothetical protein
MQRFASYTVLGWALLASWACSDAEGVHAARPPAAGSPASDASTPASQVAVDPSIAASPAPAPPPSAAEVEAGPLPAEDPSVWLAAEHFNIAVDRWPCYGTCPGFSVRVDERGHVAYRGRDYVARPGYYEVEVAPDAVRKLFVDMVGAGFLELGRKYETAADGCTQVSTDSPTSIFTLSAGDRTREVRMYWGCEANVSAKLQQFDKDLERVTTVGRFLYPNPGPEGCSGGTSRDLSSHWVIVDGPSASPTEYGLLTLDSATSGDGLWKLTSCDGQSISEGLVWRTSCTLLLLPPKDVDAYFAWPAVDETAQGAAIIKRSGLASYVTIRLLNLLEQHDQWAYEGTACGTAPP